MILLNLVPISSPALDKAEQTNRKTRIGAAAFKAFTNNCPGSPIISYWGTEIPKITPKIRPMNIFSIKLDSVHFLIKSFIKLLQLIQK